ncbi:MAG: hypothetical protein LBV58_01695 [Acholeplasmatales bacterium]|jgi:hypothetical protein|nr:hypothetical protein [Acholeplasmatales bacterium]
MNTISSFFKTYNNLRNKYLRIPSTLETTASILVSLLVTLFLFSPLMGLLYFSSMFFPLLAKVVLVILLVSIMLFENYSYYYFIRKINKKLIPVRVREILICEEIFLGVIGTITLSILVILL